VTSEQPRSIDDEDAIAASVREAAVAITKQLREQQVPIETEPPTVFRP
jgi:hypothetical protein